MAWVRFTERYIFTPPEDRRTSISYPAGHKGNVRKVCSDAAIAAGRAVAIRTPKKTHASSP